MKLTQANIAKLKIPAGKTECIEFDETMPGFGVRLRGDAKAHTARFILQYKIGTKQRRMTLGNVAKVNLEDARREARKAFNAIGAGKDPAADKATAKQAASNDLGAIVAAYLEAKKVSLRPATLYATTYYLNDLWKPLHKLAASAVTRATIAAITTTTAKQNGKVTANRARASLSAMYRWAIGEGLCDVNPVTGTNKQEENGARERSLSDAEAAAVWLAAPENDFGRIVRLILLTGCRRSEIGDLQWPEIDFTAKAVTIPGTRTKNGRAHVVPLTDAALTVLNAVPRREGRANLFGNGAGGYAGWSKAKLALDAGAKLKDEWSLHDLRRTVRTGMGMLGTLPHVAEAVLNHLPPKLIRTYDRNTYETEKRAALELWAGHLALSIGKATGANVTKLARA